ncbi:hypothetical protein C8R47DRAFT_1168842 [Mycena vitilis]|nr:hypothetical protein C8R47DRAFT_1168842 [Mycena vitilis]
MENGRNCRDAFFHLTRYYLCTLSEKRAVFEEDQLVRRFLAFAGLRELPAASSSSSVKRRFVGRDINWRMSCATSRRAPRHSLFRVISLVGRSKRALASREHMSSNFRRGILIISSSPPDPSASSSSASSSSDSGVIFSVFVIAFRGTFRLAGVAGLRVDFFVADLAYVSAGILADVLAGVVVGVFAGDFLADGVLGWILFFLRYASCASGVTVNQVCWAGFFRLLSILSCSPLVNTRDSIEQPCSVTKASNASSTSGSKRNLTTSVLANPSLVSTVSRCSRNFCFALWREASSSMANLEDIGTDCH